MLTNGLNHIGMLTNDTARFVEFYVAVFDAELAHQGNEITGDSDQQITILNIGPHTELNVFEVRGNTEATKQTPMFGRGRLDHLALQAASLEAFEEIRRRLIERGAADEFVTDFGPTLSLFFRDTDGLECEVAVQNPDAKPGVFNPPGTPAARYQVSGT